MSEKPAPGSAKMHVAFGRAATVNDPVVQSQGTTDLIGLMAAIDAAGYDWAVGRDGVHGYAAAIEPHPSQYIGDSMSGPGCKGGKTPYEALYAAAKEEGIVQE